MHSHELNRTVGGLDSVVVPLKKLKESRFNLGMIKRWA